MYDFVITGSSGFIGSRLLTYLSLAGFSVFLHEGKLKQLGCETAEYWERLPAAKVLVHLAGKSFIPDSWDYSAEFFKVNVVSAEYAIRYCKQHGARLILASAYIYGEPEALPIKETDRVSPNNPYALSKKFSEEVVEFGSFTENIPVTILRIFNVYGAGQRESFLIPKIIRQIKNESSIRLGSLTPKRDWVYIDDVLEAVLLSSRPFTGCRIINIGSGKSYSVLDVVETIQRMLGSKHPISSVFPVRENEILDVVADVSRAKDLIDWSPRFSLEQGLRSTLEL